jgi:hypothetical protein
MRAFAHRLTTCILIAFFGALTAGGQGLHLLLEHSQPPQVVAAECSQHHGCHGHGRRHCTAVDHRHAHIDDDRASELAAELCHHDHDRCPVCQFVGQPQQTAVFAAMTGVVALSADAPIANCGDLRPAARHAYQSRGPPPALAGA